MAALLSNSARVRNKYTSRACNECQRRKRKCSGEKDCRNCRHWATECVFSESRGSRHSKGTTALAPNLAPTSWINVTERDNSGTSLATVSARDGAIEFASTSARAPGTVAGNVPKEPKRTSDPSRNDQQPLASVMSPNALAWTDNQGQTPLSTGGTELSSSPQESVFERNTNFMTGAAFFKQIDLLDRSVMQAQGIDIAKSCSLLGSSSFDLNPSIASVYRDIDETIEKARMQDATKVLRSLDLFFANVHPHYPCMNESHVRAQSAAFAANDTTYLTKSNSVQIAALLNYIMAVMSILSDTSTKDEFLPGWQEFTLADKLLSHTTWLERANILTVQTLLVKTLYFMYAGFLNSAYDTMGTTVRLLFQLGLHNEPSWGEDCKYSDRTYQRRVFWSVFCMNHNVAQTRGLPELLRESDIDVGLPQCIDDRMLYPDCPALPEMPHTSPIPYLLEVIKLTRLSSEVWEAIFGARAKKPVPQEATAVMDAKIVELSRQTPASLRWPPPGRAQHVYGGGPHYIQQQGFVLHLRMRYLRMLLWRAEMISLTYSNKTAQLCVDVAAEIVEAVEASQFLWTSNPCQRHAYLHHLTGALIPMICIIVRQDNGEDLTVPATNLLNKSLKIINSFSHQSFLARRVVQQLGRPVKAARDIIESRRPQNARSGGATNTGTVADGHAPTAAWTGGHVASSNGVTFSLPVSAEDLFQDVLQKPSDLPLLWDDNGLDMWNTFNWTV
jgi:Fungal specific transcription factor domain/Fungal Zn(2)-Cys(6) binuclear cluster domain